MKLLSILTLCGCVCTSLALQGCGNDAGETTQEPGTLVSVELGQDDPVRKHGMVFRYHYRLPDGSPPRVKATWRLRFIEDGAAENARDIGQASERAVPSSGTLTYAYGTGIGGGAQFEMHFSDYEGLWFPLSIPTKELLNHEVDGMESWGGGVVTTVAPERIALDWDIPLAVHALHVTEEGAGGHMRKTLEETLQENNKVIVLYLRLTRE